MTKQMVLLYGPNNELKSMTNRGPQELFMNTLD